MANNQQIEELAAEIGDKVYIDVAKWHLYLQDAKLHTLVAEQVYPLLTGGLTSDKLTEIQSAKRRKKIYGNPKSFA